MIHSTWSKNRERALWIEFGFQRYSSRAADGEIVELMSIMPLQSHWKCFSLSTVVKPQRLSNMLRSPLSSQNAYHNCRFISFRCYRPADSAQLTSMVLTHCSIQFSHFFQLHFRAGGLLRSLNTKMQYFCVCGKCFAMKHWSWASLILQNTCWLLQIIELTLARKPHIFASNSRIIYHTSMVQYILHRILACFQHWKTNFILHQNSAPRMWFLVAFCVYHQTWD